jgi:hypothetical protein
VQAIKRQGQQTLVVAVVRLAHLVVAVLAQ